MAERLRGEVLLLPWLAERLPSPVPRPEVFSEDPLRVRHRVIEGDPCPGRSPTHARALGAAIGALHDIDADEAQSAGFRGGDAWASERGLLHDRLAAEVVRALPEQARGPALGLVMRLVQADYSPAPVHGDLGEAHVRVTGDEGQRHHRLARRGNRRPRDRPRLAAARHRTALLCRLSRGVRRGAPETRGRRA